MMKKNKIFFVLLAFIFSGVFFTQCKKYEEDDVFIQWKKPEKRLIKYGPWVFEKLTVDGVDKSVEFRADSAYFEKISFWGNPGTNQNFTIYETNGYSYAYGIYDFSSDKKELKISAYTIWVTALAKYGPVFSQPQIIWEILRLSKKGVTLKTTYNGSDYIFELKPI